MTTEKTPHDLATQAVIAVRGLPKHAARRLVDEMPPSLVTELGGLKKTERSARTDEYLRTLKPQVPPQPDNDRGTRPKKPRNALAAEPE